MGSMLWMAMAAPQGAENQQSPAFMFIWIFLMIGIFYVLMIRPQQRREKERRKMLEAVKTGDRVAFGGGILGTVANVKDKVYVIKIADNVKIEVSRGSVQQVLQKGETPEE